MSTESVQAPTRRRVPVKDVIVVAGAINGEHFDDLDWAHTLAEATGCVVVVLEPGATLETYDATQMAAAGWIRAEDVARYRPPAGWTLPPIPDNDGDRRGEFDPETIS